MGICLSQILLQGLCYRQATEKEYDLSSILIKTVLLGLPYKNGKVSEP